MSNLTVSLGAFSLTTLVHRELKWRKVIWEAVCPELGFSARASSEPEACEQLEKVVRDFLQTASPQEIKETLAKGTTCSLEPLPVAPIVRGEAEPEGWLQRVPDGALAAVGAAKDKAVDLVGAVSGAASTSGHFVAGTAAGAYGVVGEIAGGVYHKTHDSLAEHTAPLLIGLTERTGDIAEAITTNSTLQGLAKSFKLDKWLDISNHVDTAKAAQSVADLKRDYPDESNRQIAERLIRQKAIYAGGVGISTSLPGIAIPMLALDMAATSLLQTELVLQIAAAYGLDLEDPARKGEMLAVFGCVLGGVKAGKAGLEIFRSSQMAKTGLTALGKVPVEKIGLSVFRNIPVMGAVLGATSNALIIYALGNAACSFYEKRLDLEASPRQMEAVKADTAFYLQASAEQKWIADQVLLHVVLAGNPAIEKDELLSALRAMDFSPAALESLQSGADFPQTLDGLLPLLTDEFGDYISTQALKVAQMDDVISPAETEVLEIINRHFAARQSVSITRIGGETPVS